MNSLYVLFVTLIACVIVAFIIYPKTSLHYKERFVEKSFEEGKKTSEYSYGWSPALEYNGYRAKVEFDTENNIFIGTVIGIKDSLNFHATNVEDLKDSFKKCVDDYLELCEVYQKVADREHKSSNES